MKTLFVFSLSVLPHLGCSQTQFFLQNRGPRELVEDYPPIEVTDKDRLSIFFRVNGNADSTCAIRDGENKLIAVNVVESNEEYLLLSSSEWKTVQQIPRRYLSLRELRIRSPNAVHDKLTVSLPLGAIEEIRIADRDLEWPPPWSRLGEALRWSYQGAAVGFYAVVLFFSPDADDGGGVRRIDRYGISSNDVFKAAATAGVGGALLYPAARLLWPESTDVTRSYQINSGGGYRVDFKR